jgi:hypothetical protein
MPRFVLLEHRWDGVHYDLMLEGTHALHTWAIDAPVAAGAELPARALADHRLAYLDYEGEVSGGRGSVRRVDGGTYVPRVWREDEVCVELRGAQLVGTAELRRTGAADGAPPRAWVFRLKNLD